MHCYILGGDNTEVAPGEIGELHIGGDCLGRGYLNQPQLTNERFIKSPLDSAVRLYKTGDLCRTLPDGTIECLGRADHQLKIRGFLVEPSEVERCLVTYPVIKDAVVLAQTNAQQEKQLIAYYILHEAAQVPTTNQMRDHLEAHLPHYMIPSAFVRVDAFPMNGNNKLDRDALPVPQFNTNQHYLAPRTALEKKLAQIWVEELQVKVVGIEDDFFELGGNSLSAARVISSIRHQLAKDVALREFYQAGTIKKLIPKLKKSPRYAKKTRHAATPKEYPNGLLPLSDFQLLIWLCNNFEPNAQKLNIIIRKRIQGRLDNLALETAFAQVLNKHDILFSRILRFRPAQRLQPNLPFAIQEMPLQFTTEHDTEATLNASVNHLLYYHPWTKDAPLIMARLFRLPDNLDELQISMSHLVSDYISAEILLSDLSELYLAALDKKPVAFDSINNSYKEYILNEQHYFQNNLDNDIQFWEEYLKDASLIALPKSHVIPNMEAQQLAYSTYVPLAEKDLTHLQLFCAKHYVSISDGLTAALLSALFNCCEEKNTNNSMQPIFVSMVKSTRDDPHYDNTIGCFLRVESIKVALKKEQTLTQLAAQIHQASMDAAPYQQCSSLVKIASVSTFYNKPKRIKNYLINTFTYLYSKVCHALQLNRKILNLCGRLAVYERDNHFIININVQPTLLTDTKARDNTHLFGLKIKSTALYPCDLLKTHNVFDVCFLRDDNQNTPYVVISANVTPAFREQVAKKLIQIIHTGVLDEQEGSTLEKV